MARNSNHIILKADNTAYTDPAASWVIYNSAKGIDYATPSIAIKQLTELMLNNFTNITDVAFTAVMENLWYVDVGIFNDNIREEIVKTCDALVKEGKIVEW